MNILTFYPWGIFGGILNLGQRESGSKAETPTMRELRAMRDDDDGATDSHLI